MGKLLNNLTISPENIHDLRELVQVTLDNDVKLESVVSVDKVQNGDPIGLIGEFDAVGNAGAGCNPEYKDMGIANAMKRWALGDYSLPLSICYTDLEGTVAQYALKNGTPIGDITGTQVMSEVIYPALQRAIEKMFWRVAWFGDTAADVIASGGVLTAGTDKTLFNITDGFFKKIFAQATANPAQLTADSANAATTYAAQKSAALAAGHATGVIDALMMDADSRIAEQDDAIILMTKAMADALAYDLKKSYNQILPWQELFSGVRVAEYNGVKVVSVGVWDRIIKAYENTGTKLNKPYRAVFTTAKNLRVGTTVDGLLTDLDVFFDHKDRKTYIYGAGKIGTQLLEDDMFQVSY